MRILVTGSRMWNDEPYIRNILSAYQHLDPATVTLVSGACAPRWIHGLCFLGADRICEMVAAEHGWNIERHPADWTKGRAGGPIRNRRMVDLGADVCHAFILNRSAGATGCADLAEKAGIRTIREEVTHDQAYLAERARRLKGLRPRNI